MSTVHKMYKNSNDTAADLDDDDPRSVEKLRRERMKSQARNPRTPLSSERMCSLGVCGVASEQREEKLYRIHFVGKKSINLFLETHDKQEEENGKISSSRFSRSVMIFHPSQTTAT